MIVKPRHTTWFAADDEVHLRLAGVAICDGGRQDTERFVRLLRWFAQKEVDFEPAAGSDETMPRVTADEAGAYLGLDQNDYTVAARLFALLQLDNWGLGGSGLDPNGRWFVLIGPEIWRFRDVRTIEDCIRVRLEWHQEAEAAAPGRRTTVSGPYFHVRVSTKSNPTWDEVQLDLSGELLEQRFLRPYREGRPLVVNGKTIQLTDLEKLRVSRTDRSAEQLRPIVKAEQRSGVFVFPGLPEDWRIADKGEDVTGQFITEPPGCTEPVRPPILMQTAAVAEPADYIAVTS